MMLLKKKTRTRDIIKRYKLFFSSRFVDASPEVTSGSFCLFQKTCRLATE
jgi:hypothetical protein